MTITNWEITEQEHDLLMQVVDRAMRDLTGYPDEPRTLIMDLTACHANGCPLDFAGLLAAPMQDFSHDVYGIRKAINRQTGKLTEDVFTPRYALANQQTIDLTPRGLTTPEGAKRVNTAVQELEAATVAFANEASEFFNEHRTTLLEIADDENYAALREAIHQMDALISARQRKQDDFLRAVAGHPAMATPDRVSIVHELTELQYTEDSEGPWALYIFGDDGLHSGCQYFAKVVEYEDEQIAVGEAMRRAVEAIAQKKEVRVCEGGDRLVFHSQDGKTTYGEGFWEATQA
jgi:hypothetical protein